MTAEQEKTTKHTPGPWCVKELRGKWPNAGFYVEQETKTGFGRTIASIEVGGIGNEAKKQAAADARLMASAPDLLAALKHVTCNHCRGRGQIFRCNLCHASTDNTMDAAETCPECDGTGVPRFATEAIAKAEGK